MNRSDISQLLKQLQVGTLRDVIRRLDDHDFTNRSSTNHPGIVEASRVIYDLIAEIEAN
ncbi:hypothetical protein SCRM01_272 [Synechococcus phage S-CRM01]|uniref:hypothetical protein n=1 Tax=Synechococcus phage S-CRM01 TaxID=1026955 RepID=UPI000209E30C|nr:hypothetical protein SCRM01_272 [Synechococcus phage S-CRM01]AEC53218.1 hypothetical protein SCRM01_272 [Synechococcus phage S-CRM01]